MKKIFNIKYNEGSNLIISTKETAEDNEIYESTAFDLKDEKISKKLKNVLDFLNKIDLEELSKVSK